MFFYAMDMKNFTCYCCKCEINENDAYVMIDEKPYCIDCYFICWCCKKVTPVDDAYWSDDFMICTECFNDEKLSKQEEVCCNDLSRNCNKAV